MADIVQNKMSSVLGDLARPTKFKCMILPPAGLSLGNESSNLKIAEYLDFFITSTSFPGSTLESKGVAFHGIEVPVPVNLKKETEWRGTFYVDEDLNIRKFFEDWQKRSTGETTGGNTPNAKNERFGNIHIYQLDFDMEKETRVLSLWNVAPKDVGQISLSYSDVGQVETFEVSFEMSYYSWDDFNGTVSKEGMASFLRNLTSGFAQSAIGSILGPIKRTANSLLNSAVNTAYTSVKDFIYRW